MFWGLVCGHIWGGFYSAYHNYPYSTDEETKTQERLNEFSTLPNIVSDRSEIQTWVYVTHEMLTLAGVASCFFNI